MTQRELRIGDAERTTAADELADHYAQGRLTTEEHHERLDRIWAARTPSELASVFTDLPGSAYRVPPTYVTAEQRQVGFEWPRRAQRSFPGPRVGLLPVVVRIALVVLLAVLVIAHLPLILLGVVIWLVLTHKLRHGYAGHRHGYAGHRRW